MAIFGIILLVFLLVLIILLCVPAHLYLRYRTGEPAQAYLRYLFLKYDLTGPDEDEKPKQPAKKKKKEQPPAEKPAKKQPMEFSKLLGMAVDLLSSMKGPAGMVIRHFRLYMIRLYLVVAEDDAAETAIAYGRVNAGVYSAYALAAGFLNLGKPDIQIRPDFLAAEGSVDFELRGKLRPIIALGAGIRIGAAFLVKTIRRRKADGQAVSQEASRAGARPDDREPSDT